MIELKTISIQNFLSFGKTPTVIDLNKDDSTLIIGKNSDVGSEGYSRNGVGKSSIFQAICWVLYNEGISTIKQDAFVNVTNKKKMVVELTMNVDGIEYIIRRGRKPSVCEVLKNGEPYTMHSVNTVDETIEKLIGMNFETFTNTVMLNTNTIPFMNMKPAGQKVFMEQMLGLDILTERANVLKAKNKDLAVEIKLEEQNKTFVEETFEKTKRRIDSLEQSSNEWVSKKEAHIKKLIDETKDLSKIDIEKEVERIELHESLLSDVSSISDKLDELESDQQDKLKVLLDEIDIKFDKTLSELEIRKKDIENNKQSRLLEVMKEKEEKTKSISEDKSLLVEVNAFIKENNKKIIDINNKIPKLKKEKDTLESGTCPYCKQKHFDKDKVKTISKEIEELEKCLENINSELVEIEPQQISLEESISSSVSKIDNEISEKERSIKNKAKDELEEILNLIEQENDKKSIEITDTKNFVFSTYQKTKDDLKLLLKDKQNELSENELNFSTKQLHSIATKIEENEKQIKEKENETNPYEDQIKLAREELVKYDNSVLLKMKEKEEHYKILIKLLTDNKSFVRKNLLDQYVPFINQRVEHYLDMIELPHRISFNNDLTVDVNYMGQSVSYGNMSNGEKGRCNFAVSMSFRDLMSVSGHQINFLGIDELLDNGIDQSGFHAIFKLLKSRSEENVFIISHRDDLVTEVSRIMTIEKYNGFSRINE